MDQYWVGTISACLPFSIHSKDYRNIKIRATIKFTMNSNATAQSICKKSVVTAVNASVKRVDQERRETKTNRT